MKDREVPLVLWALIAVTSIMRTKCLDVSKFYITQFKKKHISIFL